MVCTLGYSIIKSEPAVLECPLVGRQRRFWVPRGLRIYFGEQVVFSCFLPYEGQVFHGFVGAIEVVLVLNNGPFRVR